VENFQFNTSIEIRFSDLDAYGHVNNALFFTYLETAAYSSESGPVIPL